MPTFGRLSNKQIIDLGHTLPIAFPSLFYFAWGPFAFIVQLPKRWHKSDPERVQVDRMFLEGPNIVFNIVSRSD